MNTQSEPKYAMTISRLTVDKLGVKLYDRVSAVLAELIANSYDADATFVTVKCPMGEWLAEKRNGQITDKGFEIEISDDGTGMPPDYINKYYLRVGAERRKDERGETSRKFHRKVMGRKGVGKLAPFGICQRIEIISSGEELIKRIDQSGKEEQGYLTSHLILDRTNILQDEDAAYYPEVGDLDEKLLKNYGTTIKLTHFLRRRVPKIEELDRQLSQRFGIVSPDWKIDLVDNQNQKIHQSVGEFSIPKMENTEINFVEQQTKTETKYLAKNEDGSIRDDIDAGFEFEGGFYPITGWVAFSKENYKDDLMAGIRIYCRGKIAAQTALFNLKSGFTGEHSIRSYLVGELHADWLDEEEDLIQTDRRDILWSHELGQAFEEWGQKVVKVIGKSSREPMKRKVWDVFKEKSNIEDVINDAFPDVSQEPIREQAMIFANLIGKNMRMEEVEDQQQVDSVVRLSLSFAPHITLNTKLREAVDVGDSPLSVITSILETARIAELSSFGRIAEDRVNVIKTVERLKDDEKTLENAFQTLIHSAPWLIDPQWSPITANQTFTTLRDEFVKFYNSQTGEDIDLSDFSNQSKRPDFVLSSQSNRIELIEIKRPKHVLQNEEMKRLNLYIDQLQIFFNDPKNKELTQYFSGFHAILVCDDINLSSVYKTAFEKRIDDGVLEHIAWASFLMKTKRMHQSFLDEANRQKLLATKKPS